MAYITAPESTIMAESGGNPSAQNPLSSASGLLQITDPMWSGLKKNYPTANLTDKSDPAQQRLAYSLFMQNEGIPALQKAGLEHNAVNQDRLWHWGAPTAVALSQADPQATVGAVLGPNAAAIAKANPKDFSKGTKTLVGDVLNSTDAAYGHKGGTMATPVQYAYDNAPASPQGTAQLMPIASTLGQAPQLQTEDAEPQGRMSKLLRFLAGWGSAASQGQTLGQGLGMGASGGIQALDQMRQEQQMAMQHNNAAQQQNFENSVRTSSANADAENANTRRAMSFADLVKSGMSPTNAAAVLQGGTIDNTDMRNIQRQNAASVAPYTGNAPMLIDTPNGPQTVTRYFDKTTGQTHVTDLQGNPIAPEMAVRAYEPNDLQHTMLTKRNNQQLDTAEAAAAEGRKTSQIAGNILSVLPQIGAGTSLPAVATRTLASLSGVPIDGTDPDATQYANSQFAQLKTSLLHGEMAGLARLDRPEQDMVLHGINSTSDSNPAVISAALKRVQEVDRYNQQALKAFYAAPYEQQQKGFTAFKSAYEENKDTAPNYTSFMDNVKAYKDSQAAYAKAHAAPAPTNASGSSKVGPTTQPKAMPTWSIEP